MSSIIDRCMEDEDERRRKMSKEPMPEAVSSDSDNVNNPFCYHKAMSCPCKLDVQECLLQNARSIKDGTPRCPYYWDNHTPRQEYARQKCIDDMKTKVKVCSAIINGSEKSKTIVNKSISYGCTGCGCFLGAAFIMLMAGFGLLCFKWSCDFLLWVAGKF